MEIMASCISSIVKIFFVRCITLSLFCSLFSCLQRTPMGAVCTFMTPNYPCQPSVGSLFLNSVDLSFLMEVKSDVYKGVNFTKIS